MSLEMHLTDYLQCVGENLWTSTKTLFDKKFTFFQTGFSVEKSELSFLFLKC